MNQSDVVDLTMAPPTEDEKTSQMLRSWKKDPLTYTAVAKELLKMTNELITQSEIDFTGDEFMTELVANYFKNDLRVLKNIIETNKQSTVSFHLHSLLENFVDEKFEDYWTETQSAATHVINKRVKINSENVWLNTFVEKLKEDHEMLAFQKVFPEHMETFFPLFEMSERKFEECLKVGLVKLENRKPVFVHKTTAEYFIARFIYKNRTNRKILKFLFSIILANPQEYLMIRKLLNNVAREVFSCEEYISEVAHTERGLKKILTLCVLERNAGILEGIAAQLPRAVWEDMFDWRHFFYELFLHCKVSESLLNVMKKKLVFDRILRFEACRTDCKQSILHLAARGGSNYAVLIKWLIANYPEDPDIVLDLITKKDIHGRSFLVHCMKNFKKEIFTSTMDELKNFFGNFPGYGRVMANLLLMKSESQSNFLQENIYALDGYSYIHPQYEDLMDVLEWISKNFKLTVIDQLLFDGPNKLANRISKLSQQNLMNLHSFLKILKHTNFAVISIHRAYWMEKLSEFIPNQHSMEGFIRFMADFDSTQLYKDLCESEFECNAEVNQKVLEEFQNALIYMAYCATTDDLIDLMNRPSKSSKTFLQHLAFSDLYDVTPSAIIEIFKLLLPTYNLVLNEILYVTDR